MYKFEDFNGMQINLGSHYSTLYTLVKCYNLFKNLFRTIEPKECNS